MTENKFFDKKLIVPKGGQIGAMVFENPHVNIPRTILYNMEIELEDFVIEEGIVQTMIVLDYIKLQIKSIRELQNKTYDFPVNSTDGYIDGSIYLFHVYNPLDVTRIEFGEISNNQIQATIHYSIDFEFEGTKYAKTDNRQLSTKLRFNELFIFPDILKADTENIEKSKKLISKYYNVEDLSEPAINGDKIVFDMKIE
ncbi:hypothetical protein OOZ15_08985 [Galbibacter sp. EGI 63066]|uniref:hypothetical protein n=1 Tax=Galbibacter sp. EGI 63066 TaxID=2993559 RepID=UPI002248AFEE|nr:hypothetical protein [Galbibacter sp. EGI 63066]MCX2680070.1 hypothetical protein [Galbibacter sp. EGI 63066]